MEEKNLEPQSVENNELSVSDAEVKMTEPVAEENSSQPLDATPQQPVAQSNEEELVAPQAQESAVSDSLTQPVVENVEQAPVEQTDAAAKQQPEGIEDAKWYVLHTFSGYENVAKENLETVIDKFGLQNRIFTIEIPMEDVVEEKNGKRKVVTRKLMPGYILVKMKYGDDIWHAVTRTRGITGFVGPKGRPLNLNEEEIRKMHLEKVTVVDINIAPNDKVEVLDGPLNGFAGTVTSVDLAGNKCRVVVEMFGRETPVDLSLTQIRKLD